MITFNLFGGWYVMPYQDATMYLIICYVFGVLTACAIYLIFVIPTARKKYDKGYHAGFLDGIDYAERANDHDC